MRLKMPGMVIIDVLTKIRPERSSSDTGYESDYRALAPLKQLADETGIAVVVVHHTPQDGRRRTRSRPSPAPTGSRAPADTILILDRGGQGTTLYGRGRDIEEIVRPPCCSTSNPSLVSAGAGS